MQTVTKLCEDVCRVPLWGIILVCILLVVGVSAAYVLFGQFQNKAALEELTKRQRKLADLSLHKKIGQLAQANLSGESLQIFHKWQHQFVRLTEDQFPKAADLLSQAADENDSYHIIQAKRILATLNVLVADEERIAENITAALAKIEDVAQQNKAAQQAALERYKQLRKTVLVQSFSFGSALSHLQSTLTAINDAFQQVSVTASHGDHLKVRSQLDDITDQLDKLADAVEKLPPRVNELTNVFPGQSEELISGYHRLRQAGFRFFDINIPQELTKIDDDIHQAENQLAQYDIAGLIETNKEIAQAIDHLYDVMQKEIDAKDAVEQQRNELPAFITHAAVQNKTLQEEVTHLDESYFLNNDEVQTTAKFGRQIAEAQEKFTQDEQKIHDHQAVFTLIQEDLAKIETELAAIEKKQVAMDQDLSGLRSGEEIARQNLARFMMEYRETHRKMAQQNLPGLPKSYQNFASIVRQEIEKLDHDLNQVKINLEDITKQLIMTQEDLKTLQQRTEDLIDAAALTQEMLQYANALKQDHQAVAQASIQATQAFNTTFDYPHALDTIATAVETAEPGAYKRIEAAYRERQGQV
ncbi:septation ring formation regulator EzrA [Schleiferilactobacillus perolens]|uniref:septation ring formation regulator EzrA n=1 Tax=Schleiferilactobacillus perolens TaxID=100468 RepID=UPI003B5B37DE